MTLHGKANHVVHCFYSPNRGATVRRRTPVERRSYDNFVARGNRTLYGCGSASHLMFQTWGGLFVPTAPSGRARERAMCPAVARSFEGRAA